MVHHSSAATPGKPQAHDPVRPDITTDGEQLTAREREVLPLLAANKTDAEIANALGITLNTARTHIKHMRRKLGIGHRGWARLTYTE